MGGKQPYKQLFIALGTILVVFALVFGGLFFYHFSSNNSVSSLVLMSEEFS